MKKHWAWSFVVTLLACLAGGPSLFGQMPHQPYPGTPLGVPNYGPPRGAPNAPGYGGAPNVPGYGGAPNAPGYGGAPYGVMPTQYMDPEAAVAQEGDGSMGDYDEECPPEHHLLDFFFPCDEGGLCAPRWFDISVDAMRLQRDEVARKNYDFTHDGQGAGGVSVLNSDMLDFDKEYGFKAVGAFQWGPGGVLELGYMGTFNFNTAAQVTGNNNNLFSVFSNFGNNPAVLFDQVDRAFFHDIQYSSQFNTFELSYRRRMQGQDCRLQYSWLAGVRYFELNEDFMHNTRRVNGVDFDYMNYLVHTGNALTGLQLGGDAWITIIPGFRLGADFKAGIYGNHARQHTQIIAGSAGNTILDQLEGVKTNEAALVSEANLMSIFKINHNWTIKAGYTFMFVDGLALGIENFNPEPPQFSGAPGFVFRRVPFINTGGNVFYHGATLGMEYMW